MVDHPSEPVTSGEDLVPGWLVRLAAIGWRVLAILALGLVVAVIAGQLSTVVASIILAMVIAATLAPYVSARRARGASRASAAGVVSLLAVLVLGVVVALVLVAVVPALREIITAFQQGTDVMVARLTELGVPADVTLMLQQLSATIRESVADGLSGFVAAAADVVTVAILGGFLTFFLLMDGDQSWDWILASTDGWRRDALMAGGRRALDQVGGYVRGTSLMAASTAALAAVLMLVLGVPLAGPLAVIVLIGSFVPYVGRLLMVALVVMVTLATRGAFPAAVLLLLFLVGMRVLDRFFARFMAGRRLQLHPILAVVGLPVGFLIGGFGGLVVILPLLAVGETAAGVLITALGRGPTEMVASITGSASQMTPEGVPVWLDRLAQWSWRSLIVAALFGVATQVALLFPVVIMPVVIAIILAATLAPSADALRRRGFSRDAAAFAVTAGTGIALIVIAVVALATFIGPMSEIVSTASEGAEGSGANAVGIGTFVSAIGSGILGTLGEAVTDALGIVGVIALGGFLTFYFIRDGANVWATVSQRVPADRRAPLDAASSRAAGVLGGYMIGTLVISAFGAATQWLIMVILGLPLAIPLAVLALFAGFIPYIGGFVTTSLAFLIAVAVGDQTDIVIMFIYTIVFNIVQGNFVTPLVYGKAVSLHPAIVLLAVPIGNALAGIVGMFLVVPVAGVIAATWRAVLQTIDTSEVVVPAPPPSIEGAGSDVVTGSVT